MAEPTAGAWLDDAYLDTDRRGYRSERLHEPLDREFGRVVPGAEGLVDLAADRRDVDDAPGALRAHRRQHELREAGEPEHVDVELATGLLERNVFDRSVRAVPGVVHEQVDPAGLGEDAVDGRGHARVVGHIESEHADAMRLERGHPVHAASAGVDGEAEPGEADRG